MLIHFIKMHAQGNDFLIVDRFEREALPFDPAELSRAICSRHHGFGADGLVLLEPSNQYDAQMVIYNSDGSRARMCGSALRCVSLLMSRRLSKREITIMTDSGLREAHVSGDTDKETISVSMGTPRILEARKPVGEFTGSLVDVGNLHYVVWTEDLSGDPQLRFGSLLEHHPAFPSTVNVHFAQKLSSSEIRIKIWENAVGETLACGTGATACVCSGIELMGLDREVRVLMPGGAVMINREAPGGEYHLTGEVHETGKGSYIWKT